MQTTPGPTRIAHLTTVHTRHDTRIFLKECRSLAAAGFDVVLIVADGQGEEERDGVRILDVGRPRGRLARMTHATRRVLARALAADAALHHIHDPELLPAGLALKRAGRRVVFDAHEDLPQQVFSKPYLPHALHRPVSAAAAIAERRACRRMDAVVAATPAIRDKFARMEVRTVDVSNFPLIGELESSVPWHEKKNEVCYVGGITARRGIRELVAAMALTASGARLNLAGEFAEKDVRAAVARDPGWTRVNELGHLPRDGVREIFGRSLAALVTLLPATNYVESQPTKMFEYMSAALPVIASDFPLWREIVEGNACGLCVDPENPRAIADAIDALVRDPQKARRMGENGARAVRERYNWEIEKEKLLALYRNLLDGA